nr:ABC transporter permease [Gordonibacter sp. Marseille-P4307]
MPTGFATRWRASSAAPGKRYVARRLLQLIPILLGITLLSFGMMHLAGGDAVTALIENQGAAISRAEIDQRKAQLGLDKPFLVQYANWLGGLLTGDMGDSYVSESPRSPRLPPSFRRRFS